MLIGTLVFPALDKWAMYRKKIEMPPAYHIIVRTYKSPSRVDAVLTYPQFSQSAYCQPSILHSKRKPPFPISQKPRHREIPFRTRPLVSGGLVEASRALVEQ